MPKPSPTNTLMSVYEQLKQLIAENRLCALATVVMSSDGTGAHLLVASDGIVQGDIAEPLRGEVIVLAQALMRAEDSQTVDLGGAQVFIEVFAPPPTLVIFGGVHTAAPLSLFAKALGFRVVVVDGRAKFADPARFPHADQVIHAWPQEAIPQLRFDSSTYVTVLTHDPKFDLPAIKLLVTTGARYIGAMGSRQTRKDHFDQLRADGVPDDLLRRVYGPIGLDIGAVTPEEMALAIMAEIVAVRYNREGISLARKEGGSQMAS
ncbi:MAG: XdhC family protein [Chloroflexi bacterium]|nr:XdhC family protein [Chloroflexota bacterium]